LPFLFQLSRAIGRAVFCASGTHASGVLISDSRVRGLSTPEAYLTCDTNHGALIARRLCSLVTLPEKSKSRATSCCLVNRADRVTAMPVDLTGDIQFRLSPGQPKSEFRTARKAKRGRRHRWPKRKPPRPLAEPPMSGLPWARQTTSLPGGFTVSHCPALRV